MVVKRHFGGPIARFVRGGTTLSDTEHAVLCTLVGALPADLRAIAMAQLNAYNLVQRESDGRALNFYRFKNGSPSYSDDLPQFQMKTDESPLVRVSLCIEGERAPLHAVLTAIRGRVFCMSFSRPPQSRPAHTVQVLDSEQSWRSSVILHSRACNNTSNPILKEPQK